MRFTFSSKGCQGVGCLVSIALLAVLAVGAATPARAQGDPAQVGEWSERQAWPTFVIHAHLLPTGRVLFWSEPEGHGEDGTVDDPLDVPPVYLWDPETGSFSQLPGPGYVYFCTGHSFLPNGQLLVAGGHVENHVGLRRASIFDPYTESWIALPDMNEARWYPTVTSLPNGDMAVVLGSIDATRTNFVPQVWETAEEQWRNLSTAVDGSPGVNYPWMFVAPNGKLFIAGHGQPTKYLDTSGTGAWTFLTNTIAADREFGSGVMYEPGKVLIMGGAQPPLATAEVIDLNQVAPTWRAVGSLSDPRRQLNATILPDGTVLVTGGSSVTGFNDSSAPVCYAEVWDPIDETWTSLATNPTCIYRGYHSVALLLPDGRVVAAGGTRSDFANAELFSPPYLFHGPRPTIAAVRSAVTYGQTFFVATPDAVARVTWVRLSSVTHAINMNQRFNELSFETVGDGVNVTTPANGALAPPGHYLLFLLNADGVPSLGKIVRIDAATGLAPATPLTLVATAVSDTQIDLSWTDNADNEEGFLIERSLDEAVFQEVAVTEANVTSYSDLGLSSQTTHFYRVRAYNLAGESPYSTVESATTLGIPAAPSGLTAAAVSGTQIDLAWTDNASDEESYRIERSPDGVTFSQTAIVGANVESYADAGLSKGTTHHYRVRASNSLGNSDYSNVASATTFAPAVTLSTSSLAFAEQLVSTTSSAQEVTLTNSGDAALDIGSITASGDFAETNDCPASLDPALSCTIGVTFTPTLTGPRAGTLTIEDDAPESPHVVNLTGTGVQPAVSLTPTSLVFPNQLVGTASSAQGVTLTNSGTASLNLTSIGVTGDFARTHNCPASLAAGASCTISVTFAPTMTGARAGTLTIENDAPGSPHQVGVSGTGIQPAVSLSTASLIFPNQLVGTTSSLQSITLTNSGTAALNITGIAASGDFAQSHTCPGSVAPGLSCSISVTFTPTMTGTREGTLTIEDDAPGSPHSVELSGTGTLVAVEPANLAFGDQLVGTTSNSQTVTVTNTGADPLNIANITTSGDFAEGHACPASLGVGAECSITVTFTPAAPGSREGMLTIEDDAPGSPRTVALSGNGIQPAITLSVTSLNFGGQHIGTTSAARSFTLTNSGQATLHVTSISVTGDFSRTHNCPASLAPAASCVIEVTFTPTVTGTRSGTVSIEDDAPGSPHTVNLTGTGTQVTLSVSPGSSTSATVTAGGTATYNLTIVPGGFQGSLTFTCTGAPAAARCTVSPNPAALNGTTPVEITVTVTTATRSLAVPVGRQIPPGWFVPMLMAALVAWRVLQSLAVARRQQGWAALAAMLLALLAVSCGGGGADFVPRPPSIPTSGTPSGTSTITVAGTSGNLTSSITLTLTVN